jgi:thymidine phosphorylase
MRLIEEKEKPMTDEMKQRVIRVINELKDYSMIDEQIEDWKKVDDMDGPLSWALGVRIEVNELLADLEGETHD